MTMKTFTASALTVLGLIAGATSCFAGNMDSIRATVIYQSADASNPGTAAQLYKRLQRTAEKVCERPGETGLVYLQDVHACVHNAVADAVTAINAPALTAVYMAKNGPLPTIVLADAGNR
jgi:UrcA family protein